MASIDQIRRTMSEGEKAASAVVLAADIDGLANPYLDTFLELSHGRTRVNAFRSEDDWVVDTALTYARRRLASWYSWAVPDDEALALIAAAGPVVEVGAGGGYWAALLRARDSAVYAYDIEPGENQWVNRLWTPVEKAGARVAAQHPDATLLLCWPPYDDTMGEQALGRYLHAGGRRVAYVGEHEGGCCATDSFFRLLENRCNQVAEYDLPQFPGMHDYLTIWEAK